ncbi:MAG TPA: hypothetical protein VGC87_13280 [Pyrinomonadaceae bacterium]|jgi:hypothetical protein
MARSLRTYVFIACASLSLAASASAQQSGETRAATLPNVTIPSTELRTLKSSSTGHGYNGLKVESRVIEGERHSGNKPEAFNRGLRFVFRSE